MSQRREPTKTGLIRGLGLVKAIVDSPSLEAAHELIVGTTLQLTNADHVFLFGGVSAGTLALVAERSAASPSDEAHASALAEARAAVERHDEKKRKAAEEGQDVRNVGTDEGIPLASVAKALWVGRKVLGALAIVRVGGEAFSKEERGHLTSLAESAATGLAKRVVEAPERDAALEAEKRRLAGKKVTRADLAATSARATKLLVGSGPRHERLLETIALYAGSELPILIRGETGTGKERVAKLVHAASERRDGPFIVVNGAALAPALFESTIFGHEKGAFTGAIADQVGAARAAHRGTLFLDEVGELTKEVQPKLLRVIQERTFTPLGETREIQSDFRVIAATNAPLEAMLQDESFRPDLYFRLSVLKIVLEPLRARKDELLVLVRHFLETAKGAARGQTFSAEALELLRGHDWPGNVRELEAVVARAVLFARGSPIVEAKHIVLDELGTSGKGPLTRERVERELAAQGGNRARTAKALGVDRRTIQRLLAKGK